MLKRPVGNEQFKKDLAARGETVLGLLQAIRSSPELRGLMRLESNALEIEAQQAGKGGGGALYYRAPNALAVTPLDAQRVLIIGSCLSDLWVHHIRNAEPPCESDSFLIGAALPDDPPLPPKEYAFQIIQPSLRAIVPDASFCRLKQTDLAGHAELFQACLQRMLSLVDQALLWNRRHGMLTFVFSLIVPQQNPVGRLMPRYDLRNPVYFVEKLNEHLGAELQKHANVHYFDLNASIATQGRRFAQDDVISAFNHGSFLGDWDFEFDSEALRLEPTLKATYIYEQKTSEIVLAVWRELNACYRTIRQVDAVKMVVVDLDDTLWRGVVAEWAPGETTNSEGWPKALWEALSFLKRRGILLGVLSKNEEARVKEAWHGILSGHLTLQDFATYRINWRSKAENMAEMLAEVNLLPGNVVFIDDNPAQRAEVKAAFPEIRVLGGTPAAWRQILLWSPETQTADISAESASRTEMVLAQVAREEARQSLTPADYLASLNVRMNFFEIGEVAHPRFRRALELVNKTNQFNTTGRRWTLEECQAAFASNMRFCAFELTDRFTEYGLVGVLITDAAGVRQFVMSCRVMGLEAEVAGIARTVQLLRARGATDVFGAVVETERNLPCRNVFARCGFEAADGGWRLPAGRATVFPAHVSIAS